MEPITRSYSYEPSIEQMKNIHKKIDSIKNIFKPINTVIPYSAQTGWNMANLGDAMVTVILNSRITIS